MNPASNPQIAIPRSRFEQNFTHSTSWLHGDIIPIDCFEILPGDDYSVHKAYGEVIMSTPIAPIFGNIKATITAMYVPLRLLWDHAEEFYGANKTSAGPQLNVYKIPQRSIYATSINARSVSHYLGKPVCATDASKINYGKASVLKERAYWFIWSEWYRNQQLQDPFIMDKSDTGGIGSVGGSAKSFYDAPAKCLKQFDMFTCATTGPQYGAAVTLPLGSYAPLKTIATDYNPVPTGGTAVHLYASDYSGDNLSLVAGSTSLTDTRALIGRVDTSISGDPHYIDRTNLVADLSLATAAKINDIRYAFQLQKYLERANFGTRSRL